MVDVGLFQPLAVVARLPLLPASFRDRFSWARRAAPRASGHEVDGPRRASRIGEVVASALLRVALASVPPALLRSRVKYPEALAAVYRVLWIEQRYRMFSNMDVTPQGWWVAVGTLADGRVIDAVDHAPEVSLERPYGYAARMPNDRWRHYWGAISRPELARFRPFLAEYLCRRWNRAAEPRERMTAIEVTYVRERATHPDRPTQRKAITLLRGPCPEI
jgi:hypothetical protein